MDGFVIALLVIFAVPALVAIVAYRAWIFAIIWNWFMPQVFGLPELSVPVAIMLGLLVAYYVPSKPHETNTDKGAGERLLVQICVAVLTPLFFLLVAWLTKDYLP